MAIPSPTAFQSVPPACPKCATTAPSVRYIKAGVAWAGAPELLQLTCSVCGYGGNDFTFTMQVATPSVTVPTA